MLFYGSASRLVGRRSFPRRAEQGKDSDDNAVMINTKMHVWMKFTPTFFYTRHNVGSPFDIWVLKLNQLRITALKYNKEFCIKGAHKCSTNF